MFNQGGRISPRTEQLINKALKDDTTSLHNIYMVLEAEEGVKASKDDTADGAISDLSLDIAAIFIDSKYKVLGQYTASVKHSEEYAKEALAWQALFSFSNKLSSALTRTTTTPDGQQQIVLGVVTLAGHEAKHMLKYAIRPAEKLTGVELRLNWDVLDLKDDNEYVLSRDGATFKPTLYGYAEDKQINVDKEKWQNDFPSLFEYVVLDGGVASTVTKTHNVLYDALLVVEVMRRLKVVERYEGVE